MQAVVNHRGLTFNLDEPTAAHIAEVTKWLVDPHGTACLLLCGLCGNGKTSLALALQWLVGYVSERELSYSKRLRMPMYTAKKIVKMCMDCEKFKSSREEYESLSTMPMLIIDDLGAEPKEVMSYGMVHTPLIDVLTDRYAGNRFTVVTTNLQEHELRDKYGERIYDRLCEMAFPVVFENSSYRGTAAPMR